MHKFLVETLCLGRIQGFGRPLIKSQNMVYSQINDQLNLSLKLQFDTKILVCELWVKNWDLSGITVS